MEIVVTVINPIDDQEVEVTLNVTSVLSFTDGIKRLNVQAMGTKELPQWLAVLDAQHKTVNHTQTAVRVQLLISLAYDHSMLGLQHG